MASIAGRLRLPPEDIHALLRDHYGLEATTRPLPGERDQNVLVTTPAGTCFVFKVADPAEAVDVLEAQAAALDHVSPHVCVPRVVLTRRGAAVGRTATSAAGPLAFRLLTYVEGTPLAFVRARSAALLNDVGRQLARLDRALADFDRPALHRQLHWDVRHGVRVVRERTHLVADLERRALLHAITDRVEALLERFGPALRRGIVHHDANDHNILVHPGVDLGSRYQRVAGLIDFGDMVHGWTVAEPAVALAYALLDQPDPLAIAAAIASGYHADWPLEDAELTLLFPLALLRLCTSVCMAADQAGDAPDDDYLRVSQGPIDRSLPVLAALPLPLVEAAIRQACGLPDRPDPSPVTTWLAARTDRLAAMLPIDPRRQPCAVLDLGVGSPLVNGDPSIAASTALAPPTPSALARNGGSLAIGRYGEARYLYSSNAFAVDAASLGRAWRAGLCETRTVHLGMDLFAPAGTPVRAPLDGRVHAVEIRPADRDYGGVVMLEHTTDDGIRFHILYGHLRPASIAGHAVGARIPAGAAFAELGDASENGGWPPHLHVQLITGLVELGTAFPGVCRHSERALWRLFSPDPNVLVGVPSDDFPKAEPEVTELLARRRVRLGRNLSVAYQRPITIVRGWRQHLFDDTGRRFLDAYNNVPHVGHCHPVVERAIRDQMAVLNTNTRYVHERILELADRVTATLPRALGVCWFVNSASEANELALRLARAHTGRQDVVVLEAGYHGHTTTLVDVSPYKHAGPGGRGAPPWVHVAPLPDTYRGVYRGADAGQRYADATREIVDRARAANGVCAFLAETCPSVGGQIFLPAGYLRDVYRAVRSAGGVCIADEVQTGYGRVGSHFWAFEAHDVVPDIVVMGKSMGNGHPLAAVVTTAEIAASFDNGMEFFSTYGGNPVSCAAGLAVLDVVEQEGLQAHASRVGARLLDGLHGLARRFPMIGDVRGSGLFAGVELVSSRETREPATVEAAFVVNQLRERGVLTGTDGPDHNVVKIRPPLPFTGDDADLLVATMTEVLEDFFGER